MTVQSLIDKLSKIDDKYLMVYTAYGESGGPASLVVETTYNRDNRVLIASEITDIYPDKMIKIL